MDQLGVGSGTLYIVAKEVEKDPSDKTVVSYKTEQLPSLSSSNVKITNNIGNKDKIELKNLTKGFTYKIVRARPICQKGILV